MEPWGTPIEMDIIFYTTLVFLVNYDLTTKVVG